MSTIDPDPDAVEATTAAMLAAGAQVRVVERVSTPSRFERFFYRHFGKLLKTVAVIYVGGLVALGAMEAPPVVIILWACGPLVFLVFLLVWSVRPLRRWPKQRIIRGEIIRAAAGDLPAVVAEREVRRVDDETGFTTITRRVTAQAFVVATRGGLLLLDPTCVRLLAGHHPDRATIIPVGARVAFVDGNRRSRPVPSWAADAVPAGAYRGSTTIEELVAGDEDVEIGPLMD